MTNPCFGACIAGLALLLGGCAATTTPETDSRFGMAVTTARAQQTLRPEASRNPNPVAGIDGIAARNAINQYHYPPGARESEQRSPTTQNNISVSSGSGGQ